jgi:hypothetical protein
MELMYVVRAVICMEFQLLRHVCIWNSSVSEVIGYGLETAVGFPAGTKILFATASRPALGPT